MDQYKKLLIQAIRNKPLLWDPKDEDYKNRDVRLRAWDDIDSTVPRPAGYETNAKHAWEQLMRGFSNVLKKKEKRPGGGATSCAPWKFEKSMAFLLPVKRNRPTPGSAHQSAGQDIEFELSCDDVEVSDDVVVYNDIDDEKIIRNESAGALTCTSVSAEKAIDLSPPGVDEDTQDQAMEPPVKKKIKATHTTHELKVTHPTLETKAAHPKLEVKTAHITPYEDIPAPMRKHLHDKDAETPRFLFLKSLLPMVEELTSDDFMDFQINIITDLRRKHAAMQKAESKPLYAQPQGQNP